MSQASPARLTALRIGTLVRLRDAFASELIASHMGDAELSAADAAYARRLILGVVATQGSLDQLIDGALRNPDDIEAKVRDALCISAYELFFLGKEPYAVVDQGVELVRSVRPRAAGVANHVLRRLSEQVGEFPFGDPEREIEAAALANGFPIWLAEKLESELGAEKARAFMVSCNEPAPLYLCCNVFVRPAEETLGELEEYGIEIEPCIDLSHLRAFRLVDRAAMGSACIQKLLAQGAIFSADLASVRVAEFALSGFEAMPDCVLEIGAGRGTKTALLQNIAQARWGRQMRIVSVDDKPKKTETLSERAQVMGFETETVCVDIRSAREALGDRSFDFVFLDAPCSGLGTLRRHPEIRWRTSAEDVASVRALQNELLDAAASYVSEGGTLVYATCSFLREEDVDVIEAFLVRHTSESLRFAREALLEMDPADPMQDCHFAALLERI